MDKQSTHQKNPAPTHAHPTKTSVKSPVHQEDDLQGAIGNRQMGLLMETHPYIHPSSLNATMVGEMPMLGGMMPVSQGRIQRQPEFRGLSQEMRLENATLALPATGALVQRKLTLGTPGDMYEQEADRVARQVVDEIHSSPIRELNAQSEEERKPAGGEAGRVQRQITVRSAGDAGGELSSEWEGQLQRAKGGGQPLSPSVKEPMERAFGADFGGVRVHTGAQADGLARSIQAKAFTTGQDVFFRQGAYEPGSRRWEELLAHELTHVVQQSGGAVQCKPFPTSRSTHKTSNITQLHTAQTLQRNGGGHDYSYPLGMFSNVVGYALLSMLARKPIYAGFSTKMLSKNLLYDLLKLKSGLALTMIGNHLMGTDDVINAATPNTSCEHQPRITDSQDIISYGIGLIQLLIGGQVARNALINRVGVHGLPIRNIGIIPPMILSYLLLSGGTELMGKEGKMAEMLRLYRGLEKRSHNFDHTPRKEKFSDIISQILFPASLLMLHKTSMAKNMGFFARRRHIAFGGLGLMTSLALTQATSILPLLMDMPPEEVSFNLENPLDISRTLMGAGATGVGAYYIRHSLTDKQKIELLRRLRMFGFGATAMVSGFTLMQWLPILYAISQNKKVSEINKE